MERAREVVLSQLGSRGEAIGSAAPGEEGHDRAQPIGTTGVSQSLVERSIGAVFSFAGNHVVMFFLTYFLLISAPRVRDRLVESVGTDPERRRTVSTIVNEINGQIQRYLLVLLVTGLIVAVATWLVLERIGVRDAAMWGMLAGVFNSIPYFGPVIVSGGLFAVGLVQGGGITQGIQMSAAAIVITSLEGWLLTPALMGRAERMNALAVFLGLLLWTWVWGAWGTLLAVPMLVVIKSIADHVEALRPVGRLMAP
jgi:predicted PurR-regulated permease PerM